MELGEDDGVDVVIVGDWLGKCVGSNVGDRVGESESSAGPIGVGDFVGTLDSVGD